MVHLRLVVPRERIEPVLDLLDGARSVINVIHLRDAARTPSGDVVLCDVAREDASILLADLKDLKVDEHGSIAIEFIDTAVSRAAELAEKRAPGRVADAVVWEEVTERTSEEATLSVTFLIFMVLAGLIASVGIYQNSAILIVGAMVVGPEFGPIAGFCVAVVQRRTGLAVRSLRALLIGFPLTIGAVALSSLIFKATSITPDAFTVTSHSLSDSIAHPDFFAAFVAFCAGIAGMLSLTTAKSGALVGVLISVTTIPAAANIGVTAAYAEWGSFGRSLGQLVLNIASLFVAGIATLAVQRTVFERRRAASRAQRAPA